MKLVVKLELMIVLTSQNDVIDIQYVLYKNSNFHSKSQNDDIVKLILDRLSLKWLVLLNVSV